LKVAVDGHCWLHRGAFACGQELAQGVSTKKYINFFLKMIGILRQNGITQILVVFDGIPLPNKIETNKSRSDLRKKNLHLARAAEAAEDTKTAQTYYQRSVSITTDMIQNLMTALT